MRLTLSYAGILLVAGALLMAVVWVYLLRYVPDQAVVVNGSDVPGGAAPRGLFIPGRSDLWRAFAPKAAIVLGLLLVLGVVGGWLLAGRMLAPLNRITAATRAAGGGALSHRIALPGRRDELRELADAFDSMLARLEAHVTGQQRFAANASHELRTPLAITQTLLEVAEREPGSVDGELVHRLQAVNTRAINLTEALLVLSRADQRAFSRERVDLSLAAEQAAETLLPLAERRGVTVSTTGEPATAEGSWPLLLQLATNLVHNAIVHNLDEDGCVWVTTRSDPASVTLSVENTGAELSPDAVATFTERFQRGGERAHSAHDGVGLGLAIVASVTEAHDGTLTLTRRAGGGLVAEVRLPAAARLDDQPGPPGWARS